MTDQTSQAPEQPYTEQVEPAEETPAAEAGSPQPQAQKETPQETLTAEDYRKIAREEAMRVAQSQMAKSENRINQRIAERFAALDQNKGLLKLSDEQVQQAQKDIIAEEQMKAFTPQPSQPGKGAPQTETPETDDPAVIQSSMLARAFELAGGTEVTPQDAEWKKLDAAWNDPNGNADLYILTAIDASREKKARLEAQAKKAPARTVNAAGGTNSKPNLTAEEKISKGIKNTQWRSDTPGGK